MLYYCSSLTSLNLSNFNTNNVNNMIYMFCDCSSLISLDYLFFNINNHSIISSIIDNINKKSQTATKEQKILELIKNIKYWN